MQKDLEVNRQLIKSIIDNTSDSIYIKDTSGKYLLFNKAAEKTCGMSADDILGNDDTEVFKPEEAEIIMSGEKKMMTGKKTMTIIEKLTYKNNEVHIVSSTKGPILNQDNEFIGIFGISRDITKSKILEKRLEKSLEEQQLLIDNLQAGIIIHDANSAVLSCNKKAEKLLGLSLEQMQGKLASDSDWRFVSKKGSYLELDDYPVIKVTKKQSAIKPFIIGVDTTRKENRKWLLVNGYPVLDGNKNIEKIIISFIDITDSKKNEEKLAKQNILFRQMEKAAKIGGFKFNVQNKTQIWTKEVFHILEVPINNGAPSVPEGIEFIVPEYKEMAIKAIDKAINYKESYNQEWEVITNKGKRRWVQTIGHPIIKDGIVTDMQGSLQDITDRKKSEIALEKSELKYRLITENAVDVISVFNTTENKIVYVTPSIKKLLGFTVSEFLDINIQDVFAKEFSGIVEKVIPKHIEAFKSDSNSEKPHIMEIQETCKNGDIIWVEVSSRYEYNTNGEIEVVSISRNIEERKKAEAEMLRLSYRDQLTGLYNRRFYEEELSRLDTPRNLPISLIMADVNGLKLTNDAFGHQKGDELIVRIANILKEEARADEIISRIGGDEFVILMPKTDSKGAEKLIERIITTLSKEHVDDIVLSLSLGYGVKNVYSESMDKVFRYAEDEMYRNKLTESSSMRSKTLDVIMNSLFEKNIREMHHSKRVAEICEFIATKMDFNQEEIKQIRIAGLMHDIGKIGVNDIILDKIDKLTDEEWDEVKKHSEVGYRILSSVNELSEIAEFVLAHQERWDGKGYPKGLKGDNIPIQARIIAVAEAFDAMISDRPYSPKMKMDEAILEIKKYAGTQFDPEIAEIFIKYYNRAW